MRKKRGSDKLVVDAYMPVSDAFEDIQFQIVITPDSLKSIQNWCDWHPKAFAQIFNGLVLKPACDLALTEDGFISSNVKYLKMQAALLNNAFTFWLGKSSNDQPECLRALEIEEDEKEYLNDDPELFTAHCLQNIWGDFIQSLPRNRKYPRTSLIDDPENFRNNYIKKGEKLITDNTELRTMQAWSFLYLAAKIQKSATPNLLSFVRHSIMGSYHLNYPTKSEVVCSRCFVRSLIKPQ